MSEYSTSLSQGGTPGRSVQAVVNALGRVQADDFDALTDARRVVGQGLNVQEEFINAGGAKALAQLLRHESAMIQKKAMKAFLVIAEPAHSKSILASGALDLFLESFAMLKADSRRKELCGKVLKRLMGCDIVVDEKASQTGNAQRDVGTKNPVPWFGGPGCLESVAWEQEIVTALVDGVLMASSAPVHIRKVAERAAVKLLTMQHHTKKVIVDKHLMDDLVKSIRGLSSSAEALMKVVTCFTIMHSSNEVTFLRCGGLEALVEVASSDSNGNVGGEMAAWCLYHFAHISAESSKNICALGGVEALVQLLYSPDSSARLASAAALLALLKHDIKHDQVKAALVEANAIPALLSALQDVQHRSGEANMAVMVLLVLREISRVTSFKQEILAAGAKEMLQEVSTHTQHDVADLAKRLLKHITKKSIKDALFKAFNIQQKAPKPMNVSSNPMSPIGNGQVHFDFDLEQDASLRERSNSKLSDKMRGMFHRGPSSVRSDTHSAAPTSLAHKRFSTPNPQRQGDYRSHRADHLPKRGPRSVASERGGYAPSLGAYSAASSQRSNKSAVLSSSALKQLAKINGPGFNEEDPFPSLRSKYSKGAGALDARSTGSIGAYSTH